MNTKHPFLHLTLPVEASVSFFLLLFLAAAWFFQESRVRKTLSNLKTLRDGKRGDSFVAFLFAIDVALVSAVVILSDMPLKEIIPFVLVLLIATVPISMKASFAFLNAEAAQHLAEKGIRVTRLSAIEGAACMDVLCCNKTGTMTLDRLELVGLEPAAAFSQNELLGYASLASQQGSQDPIDVAILTAAQREGLLQMEKRQKFVPFDPATKRADAFVNGLHIVKGAPAVIADLVGKGILEKADSLAEGGYRVICIVVGHQFAGYLLLSDPARPETKGAISDLTSMGIAVKLVTGDTPATAEAVATEVGIGPRICRSEGILTTTLTSSLSRCDIFPEVFPEDRFHLVEMLQRQGYVVGMTGDGNNDASALRQADLGIAVAVAADGAKAASGIVLAKPGISSLVDVIQTGREAFGRMRTCALNQIVKTTHIALFLSSGFLFFRVFVTTPLLVMFLIFANEFVALSLASDHATISQKPCRWNMRWLALSGFAIGLCWVLFSLGMFLLGRDYFSLNLSKLQTLVFLLLVFSGLAAVYLVRTPHSFWQARPGKLLLISTIVDLAVACSLAYFGILMESLHASVIFLLGLSVFAFMFILDQINIIILNEKK